MPEPGDHSYSRNARRNWMDVFGAVPLASSMPADQRTSEDPSVPESSARAVALVTGGSRGVGRGIAAALAQAGMSVYATGRSVADADLPQGVARVACDHRDDAQVADVFARIGDERGGLDLLVNNAWGGYEGMVEGGEFTWPKPFWLQPRWRWEAMMTVGVRGAFVASQMAAQLMIPARTGLIVNVSYWAAQKYLGN